MCVCVCPSQAAHPLVQDRLLKYVYSGFLESVMGPALHQVQSNVCCNTELVAEAPEPYIQEDTCPSTFNLLPAPLIGWLFMLAVYSYLFDALVHNCFGNFVLRFVLSLACVFEYGIPHLRCRSVWPCVVCASMSLTH